MGQLTSQKIKDALRGLFSGLDATDLGFLYDVFTHQEHGILVTDGGTAATAQGETNLWKNLTGVNYQVMAAWFITPVAVTANDSNYASAFLIRRDNAGINNVTVGTINTAVSVAPFSGNLVAHLGFALTLTAANVIVGPNQVLTGSVTKTGTGVAIASATAQAKILAFLEPVN